MKGTVEFIAHKWAVNNKSPTVKFPTVKKENRMHADTWPASYQIQNLPMIIFLPKNLDRVFGSKIRGNCLGTKFRL